MTEPIHQLKEQPTTVTCAHCGAVIDRAQARPIVAQAQVGEVVDMSRRHRCADQERCEARGPIAQTAEQLRADLEAAQTVIEALKTKARGSEIVCQRALEDLVAAKDERDGFKAQLALARASAPGVSSMTIQIDDLCEQIDQLRAERDELKSHAQALFGAADIATRSDLKQIERIKELEAENDAAQTVIEALKAQLGPSERIFLNPPADLRGLTRAQFFVRLVTERREARADVKTWMAKHGEIERQLYDLQQTKQPVMASMEDINAKLRPLADDLKRVEQERDDAHQYIRHVANWMLDRLNAIENGESMRDIASALDAKSWEMLGFGEPEHEYDRLPEAEKVKELEAIRARMIGDLDAWLVERLTDIDTHCVSSAEMRNELLGALALLRSDSAWIR